MEAESTIQNTRLRVVIVSSIGGRGCARRAGNLSSRSARFETPVAPPRRVTAESAALARPVLVGTRARRRSS
jgi:hypothetical protein